MIGSRFSEGKNLKDLWGKYTLNNNFLFAIFVLNIDTLLNISD